MKNLIFAFAASTLCYYTPVLAQTSSPTTETIDDIDDVITVKSKRGIDPALAAYLAGDYKRAEFEFQANARCALRAERELESASDSLRGASIDAATGPSAQRVGGPGGQANSAAAVPAPTPRVETSPSAVRLKKIQTTDDGDCTDRGFQLYMAGLSQIKLGKNQEAKKSLYRAVAIRSTISDAHFRLALLEYQEGNIGKAKTQLSRLKRIQSRCKICAGKDEIDEQVLYLENLLQA